MAISPTRSLHSHYTSPDRCSVTSIFTRPDMAKIKQILDMPSEEMARYFGVSPSLASGWLKGTRKPIGPARKLLLLLERNPQLAEQLKSL